MGEVLIMSVNAAHLRPVRMDELTSIEQAIILETRELCRKPGHGELVVMVHQHQVSHIKSSEMMNRTEAIERHQIA